MKLRLSGLLLSGGLLQTVTITPSSLGARLTAVSLVSRDGTASSPTTAVSVVLTPNQAPALDAGKDGRV